MQAPLNPSNAVCVIVYFTVNRRMNQGPVSPKPQLMLNS